MRAGVALGSNLGDRLSNLQAARDAISKIKGVNGPVNASPIYETEAVGCEPGAANFLNAVIEVSYAGDALQLFEEIRRVETSLGRPADHARNVSRPIDVDLLYFGDVILKTARLTLPHPRIEGRRFVLQPLADIQPDRMLPGQTKTVAELLALTPQSATVLRSSKQWEDH